MPPQRVADAAHIVPYPHTMSPHGQHTPISLDNAGRNRRLKPASKPGARRPDVRRDSDAVSMHIISPRKQSVPAQPRPVQVRRDRDDDEVSIPDYPPPSFQEAIATPPLSVCPSTTTLLSPSQLNSSEPRTPTSPVDSVNSDESLEIIDMATLPVQNEPIRRRSRWRSVTAPTPTTPEEERSATPYGRALLDSDEDDLELASSPTRARHLSLSPFRLLSHKQPASPTSQGAPSSPFRNTSFFKSTTSLKTISNASTLRLPFASTSAPRSESPLGRTVFKSKERSRSRETLESWEVLEPTSLLSAIESVTSPSSPSSSSSPISPLSSPDDSAPSTSRESLSPVTPRARRAPPPPPPPRRAAKPPVSDPFQSPEQCRPDQSLSVLLPPSPSTQNVIPTQEAPSMLMRPARPYVHKLETSPIPPPSPVSPSTSTTPTRHHYPGRPLPLPPRPAGQEVVHARPVRCPEGVLIDLDERTPLSAPRRPSPAEVTDFDLLLSRLETDDAAAANYDALLLVSEIMGPAPTASSAVQPPSIDAAVVSVARRRVTKDGRVKLKLVLSGVAVDRCGICLTQFKEGDQGTVGKACRHSFHHKCIVRWVARSRTCPMCREAWS